MDREIKRLLKLSRNPNYRMTSDEESRLEDWKKAQRPVEIKPKRVRRKKTTNEVKSEDKETGELENIVEES